MDENEIKKEPGKGKETAKKILAKSADVGKNVAKKAVDTTKAVAQKIKENNEASKKEKLDPITPKMYKSKNFHIPNIIKIVDDAERRGIALCEGAIGWRTTIHQTEILCLYDEAKDMCGLQFVPNFSCNSIYCVDPFDRKRFIKADCIFNKSQEEKLAELENIAYCLGAKKCSIELITNESESSFSKTGFKDINNFNINLKLNKASDKSNNDGLPTAKHEEHSTLEIKNERSTNKTQMSNGKTEVTFTGHSNPTRPKLKWFQYDDTIKNLIEIKCNDVNSIQSRELILSGASSATMSRQTAIAVDGLINLALKKSFAKATSNMKAEMERKTTKEQNSKLIYKLEF